MDEYTYKEIAEIAVENNLLNSHKFIVIKNGIPTIATISQILDLIPVDELISLFLSRIDVSQLNIFIVKPVLSIATELPTSRMNVGDRYFMTDTFHIAEWMGGSWNLTDTPIGYSIYSYSQHKFIVRTEEGYDISSGNSSFEMAFNDVDSITVNHNMNKYPSIVVMDSSNRAVTTQETYLDRNNVLVTWTGRTSGTIICN